MKKYKYELKLEEFGEYFLEMENAGYITNVISETEPLMDFYFFLDLKKVVDVLARFDGYTFQVEKLDETIPIEHFTLGYLLGLCDGESNIAFNITDAISVKFIIQFFGEAYLKADGSYIYRVSDNLKIVFESLKEAEKQYQKRYDIALHAIIENNTVIIDFAEYWKRGLSEAVLVSM